LYDRKLFGPDSEDRVDIHAGIGYWAYAGAQVEAEFRGKEIAAGVPLDVPLTDGWNVVGNPFNFDIIFGDGISVIRNGQTLPLSEAARQGWIDGRLYRYSNETQDWQAIESGTTLSAWEGFVIKAHGPCALRFIR
jgi:hypothetical protein